MLNVISAVSMLVFVAAGTLAAFRRKRRTSNSFIVVALAFSFAAGLAQRDMWPFSAWAMMVGLTPPASRTLPTLRVIAVDTVGGEYDVDYRAWTPLSPEELYSWINRYFFHLEPSAQHRIADYLVARANHARESARAQGGLERYHRPLGPLTAPTHVLHPTLWDHSAAVPPNPFTSLRIYREDWDLTAAAGGSPDIHRVLVYDSLRQ
jgi:hypothetical protein